MMRLSGLGGLVLWALLLFGQSSPPILPGSPLPGLSPQELELFRAGLEDFSEVESAEDGLGPAFNGTSCAVCHSVPAVGGVTAMTEIRAGHRDENGKFSELMGGTLFHLFSIPGHRCQVQIPEEANVIARRVPIPLFGAGLVEAIPDDALAALEDPDDRNGDGIKGRAARIVDVATGRERIGRFGWKSQHATLLAFSADAYRNEMGITNDLFPDEVALGIDPEQLKLCSPPKRGVEDIRDRRTQLRGIDKFENFMRLLAAPPRGPIDDSARAGEGIFRSVGCHLCHTPAFLTTPNRNPVFDRKPVALYSDLLLHDVATGDGIVQGAALAEEIRTPALWGLRFRRPLLHDGSAATIDDAILRHGGEAAPVLTRYRDLSPGDQALLLSFLKSL
ncbi:MAG: di-heme oxidoredictase family protein [Bryobacteraceae bacterium]